MKKLFALIVPLLVVAAAAPGTRLLIELQETTATMQATWTYDFPQDDTISFVWWVTEEATGTEVVRDTTPDLQTEQWQHARTATDDAYLFNLEVFKIVADAWIPSGRPYVERYIIPARAPFVLVAETTETTRPDSIPDDPSQQIAEGTLWMEFTPNTTTGPQGLWSKDFNGYGTGGHLSVWMEGATVYWRIQDDSTSYQHQRTGVAAGQLNQIAVEFGPGGFKGWLNSELAFDDPYTGGLIGNDNAIVVGAMSQSFEPWTNALDGTMHTTELYDGVYDFSGRWEEPPIVPPPPVCDTCVEVIRVSWLRMLKLIRTEGPDGVIVDSGTFVSYGLPPAGYRNIDYRLDPPQTERLMYEVWSGGQQIGYALDADHGIHNCEGLDNGEVCPVRPFRPSARHLGLLGPYRGGRLA
jgi:hypothetical protein